MSNDARRTPCSHNARKCNWKFLEAHAFLLVFTTPSYGLLVTRYVSILHLADLDGLEALEKSARPFRVELRVTCFDAEKEAVDRGALEFRHVENWVIRLRQPVQNKDGQKSGK